MEYSWVLEQDHTTLCLGMSRTDKLRWVAPSDKDSILKFNTKERAEEFLETTNSIKDISKDRIKPVEHCWG